LTIRFRSFESGGVKHRTAIRYQKNAARAASSPAPGARLHCKRAATGRRNGRFQEEENRFFS
jgi:hypothetical protein